MPAKRQNDNNGKVGNKCYNGNEHRKQANNGKPQIARFHIFFCKLENFGLLRVQNPNKCRAQNTFVYYPVEGIDNFAAKLKKHFYFFEYKIKGHRQNWYDGEHCQRQFPVDRNK